MAFDRIIVSRGQWYAAFAIDCVVVAALLTIRLICNICFIWCEVTSFGIDGTKFSGIVNVWHFFCRPCTMLTDYRLDAELSLLATVVCQNSFQ